MEDMTSHSLVPRTEEEEACGGREKGGGKWPLDRASKCLFPLITPLINKLGAFFFFFEV